ncbi:hypothetical protein DFH29DRAFT_954212, partial [Suillus ampliporus]
MKLSRKRKVTVAALIILFTSALHPSYRTTSASANRVHVSSLIHDRDHIHKTNCINTAPRIGGFVHLKRPAGTADQWRSPLHWGICRIGDAVGDTGVPLPP